MSESMIRAQIAAGRWQRVSSGVLVAQNGALDEFATLWSVLLATGRGALLSHESAAYLQRLMKDVPRDVHISVPAERNPVARSGVIIHRRRYRAAESRGWQLPQTSVEDTVLDLADDTVKADRVVALVVTAIAQRRTTAGRLGAALASRPRARWRELLCDLVADSAGLESALEWRFLRDVVRPHGLPEGKRQDVVGPPGAQIRRDMGYDEWSVVVELDGRLGHVGVGAFRDMNRDNAAAARGEITVRYGWFDVAGNPCAAAAQFAQVLRSRGWTGTFLRCPNCPASR